MKTSMSILLSLLTVSIALGDIHDPPSNDYGPTRKLGRGLSNFFFAPAEIPVTIAKINKDEGNAAAAGYGVVRGLGQRASPPRARIWRAVECIGSISRIEVVYG